MECVLIEDRKCGSSKLFSSLSSFYFIVSSFVFALLKTKRVLLVCICINFNYYYFILFIIFFKVDFVFQFHFLAFKFI